MATYNQVSYGSKGSDVTELQKLLNQNGYSLDTDGIFGAKTQAAVKDYQQKNNLSVDGIAGKNTWGALTSAGAAAAQPAEPTPTQPAETKSPGFQNNAYQESDVVKQAQAMIQQQLSQKPGQYTSAWQAQLNDIIQKIQNREQFSYDLNGDALYQQYKDQYTTQGKMAMMDTMGQAQAMTGGYGNSYAQSVGQQAYQSHLQQLNDKVPELYQLALSKYQMEGDEMKDQASLIAQMENLEYGRYRDQVSDYNTELDRLQDRYDTERDYDYSKWADERDFGYGQYIDDRNYQYQQGRDQVADEQWQKEFDFALQQYTDSQKKTESKSPSGGNPTPKPAVEPEPVDEGFTGTTYSEAVAYLKSLGIDSASAAGIMTASEWSRRKSSGSANNTAKQFTSYAEYLQYTVDSKIATQKDK